MFKSTLLAYLMVAIGSIGLTVSDLLFKHLVTHGGSAIQLIAMFIPTFLVVMLVLATFQGGIKHHFTLKYPRIMFIRSIFVLGFTGISLWGLTYNPYSQHVMLLQLGPVFTAIAAAWMLGERMGVKQWLAASVCLFGVVLIIDPQLQGASIYLMLPIVAVASQAIGNMYVARHRDKATALGFTFWGSLGSWFIGLLMWLGQGAPLMAFELVLLLQGVAVIMALSITLLLRGLQAAAVRAQAGTAALMMYVQMPVALLLGWVVLNDVPNVLAIVGATLIVATGVMLVLLQLRKQ